MHPDIIAAVVQLERQRRIDRINQNSWKFEGDPSSHPHRPKRFPFRRA